MSISYVKALLACVDDMVRDWDFKQIIFAHGTNPYTEDAAAAFRSEQQLREHDLFQQRRMGKLKLDTCPNSH